MVKEQDSLSGKMKLLAAGGFRDITRIASSDPEIWENIILSNREKIKGVLDIYIEILNNFKIYVENYEKSKIYNFFYQAKCYRDSFNSNGMGSIAPSYEITLDVVDKPGIIAKIATLLSDNDINIKNIGISNNREFENGCLKIKLQNYETLEKAYEKLKNMGYKVFKS